MTPQEIDRIECAIRHIESSLDVDPWVVEIAVEAMQKQIPKKPIYSDFDDNGNDEIIPYKASSRSTILSAGSCFKT